MKAVQQVQPARPQAVQDVKPQKQEYDKLDVLQAEFCRNVKDLKCIGKSKSFPSNVGKVWFLTKIKGKPNSGVTRISRVWGRGGREINEIPLNVEFHDNATWRTYSSMRINPHEKGDFIALMYTTKPVERYIRGILE